MCVVSMVIDQFEKDFRKHPWYEPWKGPQINPTPTQLQLPLVTKQEFEELRKEVQELKELLKAAKKYDEATNQKDCEQKQKVAFLKQLAEFLGVDITDLKL